MYQSIYFLSFLMLLVSCNGTDSAEKDLSNTIVDWGEDQKEGILTKIETNKKVYNLGNLVKLKFSIKNNTKDSFTFCPWGTPLETPLTSDCLEIQQNGQKVQYSGMFVKRAPAQKSDYSTIAPNEEVHNILLLNARNYAFNKKGNYHIAFKSESFQNDVVLEASNLLRIEMR